MESQEEEQASSTVAPAAASSKQSSSSFNEENFMRKLDAVTPTQDSIQTLALWIIHHKNSHDAICRLWLKKLGEQSSNVKHRLALFYLANDVIQNCKRKNAKIYQDTFRTYLAEAVNLVKHESINKNIERVIDVWAERGVYDKQFNESLRKLVRADSKLSPVPKPPPPPPAPVSKKPAATVAEQPPPPRPESEVEAAAATLEKLIATFQPKALCESIGAFGSLTSDLNLAKVGVEATRVLDVTIETIRQHRDRQQCAKFKSDFEASIGKLEDYIKKATHLAGQRAKLVELMEQGEIFYDAQFSDATRVFNAYRVYGMKVHAVKNRLDELVQQRFSNDTNVDMEMSDEDAASNEKENSKHNNGYRSGSTSASASASYMRSNSSSSSSAGNGAVRSANLDPRQNRTPSSSSSKKSSSSHYPDNRPSQSKDRERSGTPVRDEMPPPPSAPSSTAPLDFLTKFINKSSSTTTTTIEPSSTSKNLSFIFNQLQKIVNNPAPAPAPASMGGAEEPSQHYQQQHFATFYDPYAAPAPAGGAYLMNQQVPPPPPPAPRAGTPTKDELYSPAPPQQQQQYTPGGAPYSPMMAPPYHPLYMQPNLGMPPPQLMIDPNSPPGTYPPPGFMQFNQPPPQVSPHGYYPSKMMVSPVAAAAAAAAGNPFWSHQQSQPMDNSVLNEKHDSQSSGNLSHSPPTDKSSRYSKHSSSSAYKRKYSDEHHEQPQDNRPYGNGGQRHY